MVSRQEIRDHVARLLDSEQFVGSRSVAKLLTFCVDAALAGDEESLKETTIGIFCFGRSPGYDTKQDSIVRVTARRLRKKLELFYQNEEECHDLRILLPKGTYVPRFNRCSNQPPAVESIPDENSIVLDQGVVSGAEPLSLERIPLRTPLASVKGSNWLQPAMWSFLAFLVVAFCGVFLTRTVSPGDAKSITSQEHPSRMGSLSAYPASMASGIAGQMTEPHDRHPVAGSTEDTVSVEPRL